METIKHCVVFNDNQEIKRRTSGAYRFANQLEALGWRVTVVDWVSAWSEHELTEYLDQLVGEDTLMFAVSYTWMRAEWTQEFVSSVQARYPGRRWIAGGQQFYQQSIGCDAMLFGYSELAVECVLAWLFEGADEPRGTRPPELGGGLLMDCNTDYPARGLPEYSISYRPDDWIQPREQLTVELSRGCRFECKYCNYAFLGIREDTSTSRDQLRNELERNYRLWGTTNYIIADDTLNDRDSKLEMLADVVESLDFEPNFASFIRIDLVATKPRQMQLLSRARVWAHFYGVETFDRAAGGAVGKGMDPNRIKQALLDMREHMMSTVGYYRGSLGMIAGLPHETPDSWQASEQWLRDNWADNSWEWWPLEISTDTLTQTTSIFSKEWHTHGYREIEDPLRIEQIEQMFRRTVAGVQHKFDTKSLMWCADWADIGEATEFCRQWRDSKWHTTQKRVSNFHILNVLEDVGWEDILTYTDQEAFVSIRDGEQYQKIIKPYIERKLKDAESLAKFNSSVYLQRSQRRQFLDRNRGIST